MTLLLIAAGSVVYYQFFYRPAHPLAIGVGIVLGKSVEVVDTPAEVRMVVRTLKEGERVEVLAQTRNWVRIRLADGQMGWVEGKSMVDAETYEAGQRLLKELNKLPAQAVGHTSNTVNLRVDPSREGSQIGQLGEGEKVEIFGRRLVEQPSQPPSSPLPPSSAGPASESTPQEAWYFVRADTKGGWALGRLVDLDLPESISTYAQGTNLVAWLVLNTVDDNGQKVPQYLLADRVGTQEFDFNHIRVLTWWEKTHRYVTAYVESSLDGYFPIRVVHINGVPYFRLRLVDSEGRKFQKIYELSGTITYEIGTLEGWESDAMPTRALPKPTRTRLRRHARARH